jgi:hypothetical protein
MKRDGEAIADNRPLADRQYLVAEGRGRILRLLFEVGVGEGNRHALFRESERRRLRSGLTRLSVPR